MAKEYIIILDTNFLLIPAQFKVDIFTEIERISEFPYKLAMIDATQMELDKIITEQRGKHREAAKLAKSLAKAKDLKILPTPSSQTDIDSRIVDYARVHNHCIVATQDRELKSRIHAIKVPVITLRQQSHLVLEM